MNFIKLYLLTAAVFVALDFVWITRIASSFYERHLGHFLRPEPLALAAVVFYLIYLAGILVFAILPALEADSLTRAIALGGLLGLVAFSAFDLTCLALFDRFPMVVVVVDLLWGTFLTGAVAGSGFAIAQRLGLG